MKKLNAREFKKSIEEIAAVLRQQIELEVDAFPADPKLRADRLAKTADPISGYRFFAETYFPHYLTMEPSVLHEHLYEDLPQIVQDKNGQYRLIIAPRSSAKSTHVSLIFPLWCIVRNLKHYIVLIMDAFEQAAVMLEALKAELEANPRLRYDFPDVVGQGLTWREGDIITRNKVKVECFGTGKKIRGRRHGPYRPDLAILDDIENDQNVDNPKQRRKLESWISKAVLKLGPPDGSMDVLYAGTVLHFDAVIVRFSKKPKWETTEFRAMIAWPDRMDLWEIWEELFLNQGEKEAEEFYVENKGDMDQGAILNWPANHTLEFLMTERVGEHSAFESEYQNKPISEDNPFRDITFWVREKPNLITFGAIDPSLGKRNKGRDPSAILIGGFDPITFEMDLLEASIRKRLPDIIISETIELQRLYRCNLWFVEAVQFQEFLQTTLMKEAARQGIALPTIPVTPSADKDLRIERLQPPVKAGLIRLHSSQRTLIDQLEQWPDADHDDGPDCLDMLWQFGLQYSGGAFSGTNGIHMAGSRPSPFKGY